MPTRCTSSLLRRIFCSTVVLVSAPATGQAPTEDRTGGPLQQALEDVLGGPFSRVRVAGRSALGVSLDPARPADRLGVGRLFDDRPNDLLLQQAGFTVEQPLQDPSGSVDWGFRLDVFAGTDARYTQGLWPFDRAFDTLVQLDLNEANAVVRLPLGASRLDLRLGLFPTLLGFETVDPEPNWLLSRSFLFSFGTPLKHAGLLATLRPSASWEVSAGVVRGYAVGFEDNNDEPSFLGGVAARLPDGAGSVNLGVFYGPETDGVYGAIVDVAHDRRFVAALTAVVAPFDGWSFAVDTVYGHDDARLGLDGGTPEWAGAAAYVRREFDPKFAMTLRYEVFRDDDGFAAFKAGAPDDALDLLRGALGALDASTGGLGPVTLHGLSVGATWRPCPSVRVDGELRYDRAEDGRPFDSATSSSRFTVGIGVLIRF